MGATAIGHDDHLHQGAAVGETAAELNRAKIINRIRTHTIRADRWRCDLKVTLANKVDRCLGAMGATNETLCDFIPEPFVQVMSDRSTSINAAINDQLMRMNSMSGSDGAAAIQEQSFNTYRNQLRAQQQETRDSLP